MNVAIERTPMRVCHMSVPSSVFGVEVSSGNSKKRMGEKRIPLLMQWAQEEGTPCLGRKYAEIR